MQAPLSTKTIVDELLWWSKQLNGIGPIALARMLRGFAAKLNARSMAYNLAGRPDLTGEPTGFAFYASRKSIARFSERRGFGDADAAWVKSVIANGNPVSLNTLLRQESLRQAKGASNFHESVLANGYKDAFCIPVYGPHRIDAVISFGFDRKLGSNCLELLECVANILPSMHCEFVRIFYRPAGEENLLSERETEVLNWIAKGKSAMEVALILRISSASVDTYTRRIFKKLGVNDRVSAAVAGIEAGLIEI
ncbi:response regulator transcription factor [Aurantiacibacter luteus]|uniref:response regulator transcription factor n=1 Tax=Aurantiacibacter luteus TaxID=1581420 RepID=UPI0009E2A865|nr:helix-turn-helix transcriptional regulator [Aurantiacibacter luteus]